MLCLAISFVLGRPDGFFSSTAAIICMQQTTDKTFDTGIHRLLGTAVGGTLGYISLIILQNFTDTQNVINVFLAPFLILFMIYFSNVINHKASAQIGCIVLLGLLVDRDRSSLDAFFRVINRILDTSMGIVIAVLINKFVFPFGRDGIFGNKKSNETASLIDKCDENQDR
jgi:uncharacterized membrane protein YgaE (UPF0421/DUF939 family)